MRNLIPVGTAVVLALALSVQASVVTVNFDDLPLNLSSGGVAYGLISDGYAGFNWTPTDGIWQACDTSNYHSGYGNTYGATSGTNFASNGGCTSTETAVTVSRAAPFNFISAEFSTWASNDSFVGYNYGINSALDLTVTGYLGGVGGQETGAISMNLSSTGFTLLSANGQLNGIDTLVITTDTPGGCWIMDDFTYSDGPAVTPEPATMGLLGLGLGGLLVMRRRRIDR
jgi:hypothetical protein